MRVAAVEVVEARDPRVGVLVVHLGEQHPAMLVRGLCLPDARSDVRQKEEHEREVDEALEGGADSHDLVQVLRQFVALLHDFQSARKSKSNVSVFLLYLRATLRA